MRTGHSLKPNFLNNAALQRVKVADFPDHWCGSRMKKENYGKQYVTVCDLALNKNVSLPLSFFLTRVAYLSSFLSFWVKCSSLLFLITSLSVGLLLSQISQIGALNRSCVKRLSRGRQATSRRYLYTNVLCK